MKDTTADQDDKISLISMDATETTTDEQADDNAALNSKEGGSVNRAMSKLDDNTKRQKHQDSLEHIKKGKYIQIDNAFSQHDTHNTTPLVIVIQYE